MACTVTEVQHWCCCLLPEYVTFPEPSLPKASLWQVSHAHITHFDVKTLISKSLVCHDILLLYRKGEIINNKKGKKKTMDEQGWVSHCVNISYNIEEWRAYWCVRLVWNSQKCCVQSSFTQFNAVHDVTVFLGLAVKDLDIIYIRSLIGSMPAQSDVTTSLYWLWELIIPHVTWVGTAMSGVIVPPPLVEGDLDESRLEVLNG